MTADYEFVTEPPIMADFGDLRLTTFNTSLNFTWSSEWDNDAHELIFDVK